MCELFEKHDSALIEKGRKLGWDKGVAKGKKLGLDEGKKLGLDEGKKLGLDEGKKLGLDEGKAEMASSIARNLIAMSMPESDIAKATGLSIDEVQALMAG